jgi:hypothetical protein
VPKAETTRRFPPPWSVKEIEESFVIQDAHWQPLVYLYFDNEPELRGHRQQIEKSAALTVGQRSPYSLPPRARERRARRQAEPDRPRLRRAERPARAAWAAQRLLVDVAISV